MKKRILIPYILFGVTLILAAIGFLKSIQLSDSLEQLEADQSKMEQQLETYRNFLTTDSLLLSGQYDYALQSYQQQQSFGDERLFQNIAVKMALANKLKQRAAYLDSAKAKTEVKDSLQPGASDLVQEVRGYDSLSFAHEKIKVQLSRLRNQLQQKAYGEYLTFKSKKGNTMHYVGQVKNGRANGSGIAILDTGSRYQGQWQDNQRHGKGTFYWPDGEYYIGAYKNDRRNGLGTYYWPNGEKYVGFWKDDKRNGQGEFYAKDGSLITSGTWKNDKLAETKKQEKKTR